MCYIGAENIKASTMKQAYTLIGLLAATTIGLILLAVYLGAKS